MSEGPPKPLVGELAPVIDLEAARMRALQKGVQEVGTSWKDWEKLGNDLLAYREILRRSFLQMEERADPEERVQRTHVLLSLIETWSLLLEYAVRARRRKDIPADATIVKVIEEEMNGPEPKEYDRSFADLCRHAGISPFIQGMLSADQRQSLLESHNDSENTNDIREAIATEAAIATIHRRSSVGDVGGSIEQYLRLVHLLNAYPTHDDNGANLYGFDDIDSDAEDLQEARVLLEQHIIGKYPFILVD